ARTVLKRGIQRIRNRRFRPYVKRKHVEGLTFDLWVGDADGRDWYDLHCTDPDWPEMRFIRDHLVQPGDVVFECGAHHGCTTVMLSRWVGDGGAVVAFEPVPANCAIIEKTLALNAITNVTLERKAVGATAGTVRIDGISNSSVLPSGRGIATPQVRLDDYAARNPTLLKLDVEGYEVEVLKGARNVLRTRPKLAIEVHAEQLTRFASSVDELLGSIDMDAYRWWVQWTDQEPAREYDGTPPITTRVHLFGVPTRTS
ncbi:MAG: FkbM family methyltransferase, partial [Candidatus Rokuibacteriota bacterium]